MSNELTHHASWHCLCQDKAGLGAGEGWLGGESGEAVPGG